MPLGTIHLVPGVDKFLSRRPTFRAPKNMSDFSGARRSGSQNMGGQNQSFFSIPYLNIAIHY